MAVDTGALISLVIADRDKIGSTKRSLFFYDSDSLKNCEKIQEFWKKYKRAQIKVFNAYSCYRVEIENRLGS